jgi:Flp pilus assembly protein TadG
MYLPSSSDRGLEPTVARHDHTGAWRRREDRERGQAMVEFALILFPLLILVAGVIQFGIGLNFWLDENRIANQGARFAVVNQWPGCDRTVAADGCVNTPTCGAAPTNQSLVNYLECQAISKGLRNSVTVTVCYPNDGDAANDGEVGTPVRVRLEAPFKFVPILNIGTIKLRGSAEMRLEQDQTNTFPLLAPRHLTGVTACP